MAPKKAQPDRCAVVWRLGKLEGPTNKAPKRLFVDLNPDTGSRLVLGSSEIDKSPVG